MTFYVLHMKLLTWCYNNMIYMIQIMKKYLGKSEKMSKNTNVIVFYSIRKGT